MGSLLILACLLLQDDATKWIELLDSDSIEEREDAARRLQRMGTEVMPRLEKAKEMARSSELRLRIDSVLTGIRKSVELAKVFGPTRRVTMAARGRLLKEILADLKTDRVRLMAGKLDEEARLDFQVQNVTWWEAIDKAARAAKAWYTMEWNEDGTFTFELKPGLGPENPVVYIEQFRISVAESKRIDYRTPAGRVEAAVVSIEVRHQADLHIPFADRDEFVRIESVTDAKGKEVRTEPKEPIWISDGPLMLCRQGTVWVDPLAALPLTVIGTTDLPFAQDTRQVELDLEGAGSRTKIAGVTLRVVKAASTSLGLEVVLSAEADELPYLSERLALFEVLLIDSEGRRHKGGKEAGWSGGADSCSWSITYPPGIDKPRRVVVPWIAEFHHVKIPFRLEGVKLPDLK